MKKAIIMCNAAMSSSLMAKKTTEYFASKGVDIVVDATTFAEGAKLIEQKAYDLFLVSPQIRMHFERLKGQAEAAGLACAQIPPQAYAPIPMGIQKLAELIQQHV